MTDCNRQIFINNSNHIPHAANTGTVKALKNLNDTVKNSFYHLCNKDVRYIASTYCLCLLFLVHNLHFLSFVTFHNRMIFVKRGNVFDSFWCATGAERAFSCSNERATNLRNDFASS